MFLVITREKNGKIYFLELYSFDHHSADTNTIDALKLYEANYMNVEFVV